MAKLKRRRRGADWIGLRQLSQLSGLSRSTLQWNIKQGYLNAEFDGYRFKVKIAEAHKFLITYYTGINLKQEALRVKSEG